MGTIRQEVIEQLRGEEGDIRVSHETRRLTVGVRVRYAEAIEGRPWLIVSPLVGSGTIRVRAGAIEMRTPEGVAALRAAIDDARDAVADQYQVRAAGVPARSGDAFPPGRVAYAETLPEAAAIADAMGSGAAIFAPADEIGARRHVPRDEYEHATVR